MIGEGTWGLHPRPQLKREHYFNLNGEWKLNGNAIAVPFPPESDLSGYESEIPDTLRYEKTFYIPDSFEFDRIILHFGAVDQVAEVMVNGVLAGKHEGGYLPFSFDITEYVRRDGENRLEVLARDELSLDYPYGKQSKNPKGMWYTPVSGIWQTVWLENVPDIYIERLVIKPELDRINLKVVCNKQVDSCSVRIKPHDNGDGDYNKVRDRLLDNGNVDYGKVQDKLSDIIEVELQDGKGEIVIPNPVNWTPDNPYLYDMVITACEDTVESYFALRTIEIKNVNGVNRVCLNNKPIFLHGVLDQGYFKDGIFLPADEGVGI